MTRSVIGLSMAFDPAYGVSSGWGIPAMIRAGRLHGIVLVRPDLWQLIEDWLRKFTLLKIE